jgi:OOP family OmpA-OmpF porin
MKVFIGMIVALATALPAAAQDSVMSGFYAGGSLGRSEARDVCDDLAGGGVSCDDKDTAWRLFGGYRITPNLAVELGYTDLGEVSASGAGESASVEARALEATGLGMLPLSPAMSLYAKAGVYRGEVDGRFSSGLGGGSAEETNTDFTFGFGAQFDLARNVALRGEWQRYRNMGGDEIGESDVDLLSVGVLFKF